MNKLQFLSSDKQIIEADKDSALCFGKIKAMLECCPESTKKGCIIPLWNINSRILRMVFQWADHHKNDAPPAKEDEEEEKRSDDISEWDIKFLEVAQHIVFELMIAVKELENKDLLELCYKTVANLIKGKSTQAVREMFHITADFTPAQEELISQENAWCEGVVEGEEEEEEEEEGEEGEKEEHDVL